MNSNDIEVVQLSRDCICVNDKYVIKSMTEEEWLPEQHLSPEEWNALYKFLHKSK